MSTGDLISDFMAMTEHALSPRLFRLWAGITMVGGALERRVWIASGNGRQTFANTYCMLVAPPGVGKQVIDMVRRLWRDTLVPDGMIPAFCVAPNNTTKASLMDAIGASPNRKMLPEAPGLQYNSLLVAAEEASVFIPSYDGEFFGALNYMWNNPEEYTERRRASNVKELNIHHPQLSLLMGAQPGYLAATFPEEAWNMGFASRTIMVYSADAPMIDIFEDHESEADARPRVIAGLSALSGLYGPVGVKRGNLELAAARKITEWAHSGGHPKPTHSRLTNYVSRRQEHLMKLSLISGVSRTGTPVIEIIDVERGLAWLEEAETTMPDIFRAMVGRSDHQILEELHHFVQTLWAKDKKPVHQRLVMSFLAQRVPSEKVDKILDLADRAHMVQRVAGSDTYIPRPKYSHGVE